MNHSYTPLAKTVVRAAIGEKPPINGLVKIHIKQLLTDGTVLSDSMNNHPLGHMIDLKNSHVLSSLVDELMAMVPGEISQYLCKQEDMRDGLFSVDLPPGQDLIMEVEMLDWSGEDISEYKDGSLEKFLLEEGNSRSKPCWTGKCTMKISKDSEAAQDVLFRLGDGLSYGVPREIEECALTMQRGEVCTLRTKDHTYTLTLVGFEKERAIYKTPVEEVIGGALELKLRGNAAFKINKLRLAQLYYERSLSYLDGIAKSEQDAQSAEVLRDCNLNLAMVHLKHGNHAKVISHATAVLWTFPENVKALYRRAVAHDKLGFFDEAHDDLRKVIAIEPSNAAAATLLGKVKIGKKNREVEEKENMVTVFKKLELDTDADAVLPPVKSVWDEAEETCPEELATAEAYEVYAAELAEAERIRKAEAAARQAEYEAANPKKKKKKRKKKKKPATNEVTIAETVELKADEPLEPVKEDDVDDLKYEVTAEKTFVGSADLDNKFANGNSQNEISNEAQAQSVLSLCREAINTAKTEGADVKIEEKNILSNGADACG